MVFTAASPKLVSGPHAAFMLKRAEVTVQAMHLEVQQLTQASCRSVYAGPVPCAQRMTPH